MAATTINGVAIDAIASAVPSSIRTNADIGGPDERAYVEKLSAMVGVTERRVVRPGQFGSDLAVAAARQVMGDVGWEAPDIDLVVVATQTPDRLFPGIAFQVHRQLGLSQSCPVFDINLGCSAFTHGVWTAATLLPGVGRRALLVNADTMSRTLGAGDHGNQVLFGDGAAATALRIDRDAAPIQAVLTSDGKGTEAVCFPASGMSASHETTPAFVINGPAVLGLALRSVPKVIDLLLERAELTIADIGLFVPHQANLFILDKLAERLGLPVARMLVSMQFLGNTSSSSIPLALCAKRASVVAADRTHVLMAGFGTGFSVSGVIADLRNTLLSAPVDVE